MNLVRVKYYIWTGIATGVWMTTEPMPFEVAKQMLDSGLYSNAHIIEVDDERD